MAKKLLCHLVLLHTACFVTLASTSTVTATSSSISSPPASPSSSAGAKDNPNDPNNNASFPFPETVLDTGLVISGVFKEYLTEPIYYESVAPIILEYHTPLWNKDEILFNNWYNCTSEVLPYRYSCPVTYHMNKAVSNLQVDFDSLHPIDKDSQLAQHSTEDYYKRLASHSEFCDTIQKHFSGIWTNKKDLQTYLYGLEGCGHGADLDILIVRDLPDYNYTIRQPFTKMENNYYTTFYKAILGSGGKNSSIDLIASALLSNTRIGLQGTVLGQYYAERNRWHHANQDCRQGYIPTTVVTPERLNQSLSTILKMKAFQNDFELSISPNHLSKYYSLPLSDCTYTNDAFVARILVPLMKPLRAQLLRLVQVHTIPFVYKEHICRVKLPGAERFGRSQNIFGEMDSSEQSIYLFNEYASRAYPTKCRSNELCKVSEYMLDQRRSEPCVSALLTKNETGIRYKCDFECLPKDNYVLPAVVRVASDKFTVTGTHLNMRIECGRLTKTTKYVQVLENHIGAVLIKLPCFCSLIIPHFNAFHSGSPCAVDKGSGMTGGRIEEPNYNELISITSIIPFMFGKLKGKAEYDLEKTANSVNQNDMDYAVDVNAVNLTEIIDTDRIENYIKSSEARKHRLEMAFKGMDFYAEKLQSQGHLDDISGSGSGSAWEGLFWTFFAISVVVILSIQVYIIVMFKRFTRGTYTKDEGILYRVEPEQEEYDQSVHI